MENLLSEAGCSAGSAGSCIHLVGQLFRLDRDAGTPALQNGCACYRDDCMWGRLFRRTLAARFPDTAFSPDCPIASSIFRFGFEFFPADHAIHQLFLDFDKTLVKAFTFRRIFFIKLRVVQACGNLVLFIFKR